MINLNRISKLAQADRYESLLDMLLANGRDLPLSARLRLADPNTLPAAALAFAVQRMIELTYGSRAEAEPVLRRLIGRQGADGFFGSIPATALALAALVSADADSHRPGGFLSPHASNALSALQSRLAWPDSADDPLDTLLLAWALAPHAELAKSLDVAGRVGALEAQGLRHDRSLVPLFDRIDACLAATAQRSTVAA